MTTQQPATPTISRVLPDNTLIELVYDPSAQTTALVIAPPDGDPRTEPQFELASGERLVPITPTNNLLTSGCVLLPSEIEPFEDKVTLLTELRAFIHRYVDLPETFEAVAAHYVLLSWVYDAFTDLPYLRAHGDYGTGKTRMLLVLGSLVYKGFFASGASTVSPIFHIQDAFQGTLILDEADMRASDASAQLTKILNNGSTHGLPVLRTMTTRNRELHPQAFRVFGPKIVAMRERFSDLALESRFITLETSGRKVRADVPIHLPPAFKAEALALRNQLLAWRLAARFTVGPVADRQATGVSPRYRQSSWALLSLVDDADLREAIVQELAGEEARVLHERADTLEAAMLQALTDAFAQSDKMNATLKDIAERFNAQAAEELGRNVSNKWVGGFLRRRFNLTTVKSNGVHAVPRAQLAKVKLLAERYGVSAALQSP